jgi:hypothetical protein
VPGPVIDHLFLRDPLPIDCGEYNTNQVIELEEKLDSYFQFWEPVTVGKTLLITTSFV